MRIYGHEIPDTICDEAFRTMPQEFRARDLTDVLAGYAPYPSAYRGADRIIQKRRKAGEIRWISERKVWERVTP